MENQLGNYLLRALIELDDFFNLSRWDGYLKKQTTSTLIA
jgi:hypothetical protein